MGRVALVQICASTKIQDNLKQVEQLLLQAQAQAADLVVLPENFAFMGLKEEDKLALAEVFGQGPIQDKLSLWARSYKIWIIAGTIPLKDKGSKIRSACLVYDAAGLQVARYDKIHLFDVRLSATEFYEESATIAPGKELVLVDTPVGVLGLTICYDLRFPELYQQLQRKGAQLITVPSAFTAQTGKAHWEVLLRARAIENLCYILAPNQGGLHENGRQTYGHSMGIDPWGQVLAIQKEGAGVSFLDVDLDTLKQLRQQFPCNDHHVLL